VDFGHAGVELQCLLITVHRLGKAPGAVVADSKKIEDPRFFQSQLGGLKQMGSSMLVVLAPEINQPQITLCDASR